jgi:uncharacterized membrane protein (UPF0127 family)
VLMVALLALAMMGGVSSAQEPSGGATVPAAPPWRAEIVPRDRPLVVTVGDVQVPVEVANTDRERQLGLGERDGLLPGTGMLFVFDGTPAVRNFWMGGMRFCLDIVWVNDGEITGAAQSTCPGPPDEGQDAIHRHSSPGVAEFVLEVPAGFLAANDLGVGSPVTFSVDPYSVPAPDETAG